MKCNAELSVALQTASRPNLQHRSLESRSLRQNQAIPIEQRLRDRGLHWRAILRRGGIERRDQRRADQAPRRRQSTDGLDRLFFTGPAPKITRLLISRGKKDSAAR